MGWKYIIIQTPTHDIPVLFPDCLVHKDVAERICAIKDLRDLPGGTKVLSAGSLDVMVANVGGSSETLGIGSRGREDDDCINSFEYGVRGMRGQY